jgi:type II secretion system protein H
MPRDRDQAGFTLLEVMLVVLILGLVLQLVFVNLGAMVPKTKLDAEAKKLVANLDFLRSEARIQGKSYVLQLDLRHARWRMVLPAEERLTSEQTLEETERHAQQWNPLEDGVEFAGAGNWTNGIVRNGVFDLAFDENGFTADQVVFLRLQEDPKMLWTVQIRGLTGQTDVLSSFDGAEHRLEEVTEGAF